MGRGSEGPGRPESERTLTAALRVYRENPPGGLRIVLRGHAERRIGPRGRLTIEEAAVVLRRPAAAVRQAIRAGFLPARRQSGVSVVTLAACDRYLRDLAEDIAMIRRSRGQRWIPGEVVHAEFGLRY